MSTAVVELWERLFRDESTKDVEISAKDGSLRVHGVFMSALSDAFKAMLQSNMKEGRTRKVKLEDFSKAQLQFFFRLAYTGQVEPTEWPNEPRQLPDSQVASSSVRARRVRTTRHPDEELTDTGAIGCPSSLLRDACATMCLEVGMRRVVPLSPQHLGGITVERIEDGPSPPLELLLAAAKISKQYDIDSLLMKLVDKLAARLDASNFDEITCFAISIDMAPLRLKCLRFAEANPHIKKKFEQGSLQPEVMFELKAVWPSPQGQKRKFYC